MPAKATRGAHAAPTTRRAALYPRVSDPYGDRKRQPATERHQETPLDQQESACRAYAEQHGYTVDEAHIYREAHTGVELWERPQLTRLREAIRRREIDVVIVYSIDRLSRDPVHLGVILSEADHAGVAIEFVTEQIDDSPEGALIRFVRGYAAKVEHTKIVDRTRRGRRARAEAGKLSASYRPLYGYRFTEDRTGYVADPLTAPTLRRIFSLAAAGTPVRRIAALLTAEGVPTPTGRAAEWQYKSIALMLGTPAYTGRAAAWRWARTKNDRHGTTARLRPPSEQIPLPAGTVEPLIDEATFAAVQARLAANKQQAARNNRAPADTLLRGGYLRCGTCGRTMIVHRTRSRKGECIKYRCASSSELRGCGHTIAAHLIDQAAWQRVEQLLTQPELIAAELERMRGSDPSADDLAAVERSLTQAVRQQRNLIEQLANVSGAAATLITDKINALEAQRDQLNAERESIFARSRSWAEAQERLTDLQAWCRTAAANLGTMTYQERRTALDGLGVEATVWPTGHAHRYEIRASIPLEAASAQVVCSTSRCTTHNSVLFVWTDRDAPARELVLA